MKQNTLAIISLFLLCFLVFTPNLAAANPAHLFHYPWVTPITSPPQIIIHSPVENQSCKSPYLFLNFSIIKPGDWYNGGVRTTGVEVFGIIEQVYCELDNGQLYTFTVNDWDSPDDPCNKTSLDFSAKIKFDTAGQHSIKVFVQAYTQYVLLTPQIGFQVLPAYLNESVTRNFTLSSETSHFSFDVPTSLIVTLVAATSVSFIVVGVPLLFYFKKYKRQ